MSRAERRRAGLQSTPIPVAEVLIELAVAAESASGNAATVEVFEPVEPATIVMSLDDVAAAMAAKDAAATASEPVTAPTSRRSARAARAVQEPVAAPVEVDDANVVLEVVEPEDAASGPVVVASVEPDTASNEQVAAESEPVVAAEPVTEDSSTEQSRRDEFEAAARLFNFTGETPVIRTSESKTTPEPVHLVAVRRRGRRVIKRAAAAGSSMVVLSLAGILVVGLTASPAAVAVSGRDDATDATGSVAAGDVQFSEDEIQAFVAPSDAAPLQIVRDEKYGTVTVAQIASESGIQNFSSDFKNDPNAAIQWPFDVGVPMSYGYGMRSGQLHEGIDFTPGSGAPIQAIADGVVRIATESGGAYGVTVMIDHVIDGELVSSRYAHMQYGSLQVTEGQEVKVGDEIGLVGETGRAYGAHLHFELHDASGNSFDPWPWMVAHAGGVTE